MPGKIKKYKPSSKSSRKGTNNNTAYKKSQRSLTTNEHKRLQTAELLLDISKKLASTDGLDELLETLLAITTWELNADRGSLFLNDAQTGELYSIVAQGNFKRTIRIMNNTGIAGHVFTCGKGVIVHDAYKDKLFNPEVDQQTGYVTKSILCVPIKTVKGETIGVAQALNKKKDKFTKEDMELLEALTMQASIALQSAQVVAKMEKSRTKELEFLDVVADITSEIELGSLLNKVMREATRMLQADRSTLFMNDEKSNELWSQVGDGIGTTEIRFPNHLGIAGTVFTSAQSVNIPYAYADLRFNPAFDKQTGYFTRSILCVPVINKNSKVIGVTQVLNKRGGPFTDEDESRLKAFTAQIAIALENANLFKNIQNIKNYNESMLESMSNGVITLDEEGKVITCNAAGLKIMNVEPNDILQKTAEDFFSGTNALIIEKVKRTEETNALEVVMDVELEFDDDQISVNLTVLPLVSGENKKLGTMIMMEDISSEKRMKSTMSRYMDPGVADRLLAKGEDLLGGHSIEATILFSDIRNFTTLTEELGAHGTVSLLNEYFTIMVDCIQSEDGMLDKFIGDAIMAGFGIPVTHDDDEDKAVRAAIAMIKELQKWNVKLIAEGKKSIDIGIGLNTDNVVTGNIGSPKRMDYTMIGDGVNLAARLESACKQYSARILISENTFKKLRGIYRTRDVDDVVVKGKTKPVRIYEVLDYHTDKTFPNLMEVVNHFKDGREHYRSCHWDKAIKSFKDSLKFHPEDTLSQMYIDRCNHLKKNKPKDKWQGVWVMTAK